MYQIKDFSKASGLSVQALRYYDSINILKPMSTGKYNNYRYYSEEELLRIKAIGKLKEMGFKLSEIKNIINKADRNHFIKRKEEVIKEIADSQKSLKKIDSIIDDLEKTNLNVKGSLFNLIIEEERMKNMEEKYLERKENLLKAYDLYKEGKNQECYQALEELQKVIFDNEGQGSDTFWEDCAGSVFTSIAFELIRNSSREEVNFINISNFKVNGEYYFDKIKEYAEKLEKESYSYLGFKPIVISHNETGASIISVFTSKLRPYVISEL